MRFAWFVMLSVLFVLWYIPPPLTYAASGDDNDNNDNDSVIGDDSRPIPEREAQLLDLKLSIDIEFCYNAATDPNQINSFIKNSLIHCDYDMREYKQICVEDNGKLEQCENPKLDQYLEQRDLSNLPPPPKPYCYTTPEICIT
jgi:hypothetical protein